MHTTISLSVNEDVYQMCKKAAHGSRRTISNFIEYATLLFLSHDIELEIIGFSTQLMQKK